MLCLLLLLETVAFLLPMRSLRPQPLRYSPRAAIVIPAHNEAAGLAATLAPLRQLAIPIVLVADNCSDQTAAIGQNLGAIVLERHNPQQRGKGYAMDFAIDFLRRQPPEVVVFLDADCQIANAEVLQLIDQAVRQQSPVQSVYVMHLPPPSDGEASRFGVCLQIQESSADAGAFPTGRTDAAGRFRDGFPLAEFTEY
ncbi:MAG: glycosyltransferase [Alkalinema sp. RL_2_19]|nr:glycosyltransferase [Alkalinema sp. RL_2_19]